MKHSKRDVVILAAAVVAIAAAVFFGGNLRKRVWDEDFFLRAAP
jgi:hypothetical protein